MIRFLALILVSIFCFTLIGCHTMQGAAQGAKQDINETYSNLKCADGWVKKNLW